MYVLSHLQTNVYDNEIHYDLTNEEIVNIKEIIENSQFETIDIIMDFMNAEKITEAITKIPVHLNREAITIEIWHQYVCLELLNKLQEKGIKTNLLDLERQNKGVFSGDFESFEELQYTDFFLIDMYLRSKLDKKIRMHFFMDNIANVELQKLVNQIFASRASIICMGYTTADELSTYMTLNNVILEAVHDYREFHNDEYYQNLEDKRIALMKKFEF